MESTPKIAIIGGGLGGICAGIQLQKQLGITSYTIFEEHKDFGGTWYANKYPGAACDIESVLYSFSFEQNPNWTKSYAHRSEIQDYIVGVARKYGLYSRAQFSTLVTNLEWNDVAGKWKVEFLDKNTKVIQSSYFDYTIWAVGALRAPLIPPEFSGFTGKIIHSSDYDPSIDLSGKRVGVVGSGASAIQIIPAIAGQVKELHAYQRTPSWVIHRMQFDVPIFIQKLFALIPFLMLFVRSIIFLRNEFRHNGFTPNSYLHSYFANGAKNYLRDQVPDEKIQKGLMPDFQIGCKRVVLSENYYRTFNLPQVHLHRGEILEIRGNKIRMKSGSLQELDILILATGFKVQDFFAPMKVVGRSETELLSIWKKRGPISYYGIMSSDAPNSFMLLGPNTALPHNSVIFMIECQCDFAMAVIREAISRGAKAVAIKPSAEEEWTEEMKKRMEGTVWKTGGCKSWYADDRGVVTALWPKNCLSYYRETRHVDFMKMQWSF